MLRFVRRFLSGKSNEKTEPPKEQKHTNPINEIQFLEGHTDIARILLKIDDKRFCSGGDDGQIIVWDSDNSIALQILKGHTKPVTCLLLLDRNTLLSGSVDRSIKMWDLETGTCMKSIDNAHQGRIQCLTRIDANRFCSGGNDRFLHIWKNDGTFVGSIERQEEENLNCLLAISGNKLVTGSTSAQLLVYTTDMFKFCKLLAYHRESVRCLLNFSYDRFVSAAMDGSIIAWNCDTLTPLYQLEFPDKFKSDNNQYIFSVAHLEKLGHNYIAACFGRGFRVYDMSTGDCVLDCINAHEASVSWLIPLYNGTRFVTSAADASIRLWGTKEEMNFRNLQTNAISQNLTSLSASSSISSDSSSFEVHSYNSVEEFYSLRNIASPQRSRLISQARKNQLRSIKNKNMKKGQFTPILLGEMWAHSRGVNALLPLDEYSFASAASDGLIILWKDGKIESEHRSEYALKYLLNYNCFFENDELLEDDNQINEKPKSQRSSGSRDTNSNKGRNDLLSSDQDNPSLEETVSIRSDFSDDSNAGTPNTNSTGSFSTARDYNETVVPPQQPQSKARRPSTGDLFDSIVDDESLNHSSNMNSMNFVTEVPQHIYDPAEHLYLEQRLSLNEIAKQLKQEGHSDSIVNAIIQKLNSLDRR
jgi:WD40 repeat protein